ncbi:chemotaxis protein methyltransferase CheR [Desulfonauticus submarinus]|uniref:protein-glutamate O-methyltransferase n=1 Tax=Desulfonauticus submarinus TaxID=206665 RepID=A0A1H0CS88_9BACT|nr:protein-glutamate O-methyltransferase CheR [Desulfonauticus submarinus]SDN60665.1 chemotaxis protein methyltransferase CheR [Desulfonauticus submarinus]
MSSLFSKTVTLRKDIKISDEEFSKLRDFIYAQTGIYIGDNRKYLLENRLVNRLRDLNLKTFGEYYYFLRYDPSRREELNRLFDVITTNETSFFRNPPQLKVFQDIILKEIVETKRKQNDKSIHIWSAGCSTGEEPYTLSIILHEVLKSEIDLWKIKITANDLSSSVLKAAKRGIYSPYSLRTTPPKILQRYFKQIGNDKYQIIPKVAKLVDFVQLNLNDRFQIKRIPKSQVVFCRNVIIYFSDEVKKNVISSFYDNLVTGGYLFLGHSESLHNISRSFKPIHHPGSIVYKKE